VVESIVLPPGAVVDHIFVGIADDDLACGASGGAFFGRLRCFRFLINLMDVCYIRGCYRWT
jgi:hypothetical protein